MVARFWTSARRFPRLIGKTVNGDRIPGGPYTTAQAIGGFLTIWLLWETRPIWGWDQIIAEILMIAGAGWGMVWVLGKVPLNTKNPIILAGGLFGAVFSPRRGRTAGRAVLERDFGSGRRRRFGTQPAPVWIGRLPGDPFGSTAEESSRQLTPADAADVLAVDVMDEPLELSPPEAPSRLEPVRSLPEAPALTGLQQMLADAARTTADADTTSRNPGEDDWELAGRRVRDSMSGD